MAKQAPVHIVILGAGYAGMTAALRLAHKTKRLPVIITLVNGSAMFVERIRLHQAAAAEPVRLRPIPHLLRNTSVRFVHGRAVALAPQAHQVTVQTEQGIDNLPYDYLLYTLGSTTDMGSIPGVREHTLAVDNPADSLLLRNRLRRMTAGERVLVVGGGLTGIETATEIAEQYPALQVQLLTAGCVGDKLSQSGRLYLQAVCTRLGIGVHEGMPVDHMQAHAAVATDGQTVPFDLCVWAGPMQALPLARAAGLVVNQRGQIVIDAAMRSVAAPSLYAAGDSAAFAPDAHVTTRMACATAIPMGAHAADNLVAQLVGEKQKPFRFGYVAQCISLGRHDGLVQLVHADDRAREQIVTGRLAVWIKEGVCRATALSATAGWAARSFNWRKWSSEPMRASNLQPAPAHARPIKGQL